MTATVLPLRNPRDTACAHCSKPMRKRLVSNEPAYCGQNCGQAAQSDKTSTAIKH